MEPKTKKTLGLVAGGCGCLTLLAMTVWFAFLIYVGLEGRGNDEEASMMLGGITCCVALPVFAVTGAGFFFGLKKQSDADESEKA